MRFLLTRHGNRSAKITSAITANKSVIKSTVASVFPSKAATSIRTRDVKNNPGNSNLNLTRSWGQQCSATCGCVVRFETKTDNKQRVVDCTYVAKSVVATVDKENGTQLTPVYSTRMRRPMFQECKCQSLHSLAKRVTSYLPNKRWDHIRSMNDFAFTRSSPAFRHSVLSENDLPRTDLHCFDVVEEAFTGMVNGSIPSKRRMNAPFAKILEAECLQRPFVVHHHRTKKEIIEEAIQKLEARDESIQLSSDSVDGRLGVDKNRIFMTTSKTISTLGMFDINSENWLDEEEYEGGYTTVNSQSDKFDWVSYVDELQLIDDSA